MFLKKLEIQGFKSFANKTVLEFEPGITSVVGPNGSGKSNLADSLRWVFGEQSMKLLRGKKAEDVIFAGTDQKARLGAAEVAVFFDNADHGLPVDYDEVILGRRVFRDGNSEYTINGHQVRLMDIQELLAKVGFGNSSYHIIGQGMIDQLILGGPQAIKELVEEAAGIKPYYLKRDRALRRLLNTETNLGQVQALLKEIEPRLRSLRRQTKKLERRADIENELRGAQQAQFKQLFSGLDKQAAEITAQIEIYERQITDLSREIDELSHAIELEEKKTIGMSGDFQKQREELEQLRQIRQKLLEEQAIIRGRLSVKSINQPKIDWRDAVKRLRDLENRFSDFIKKLRAGNGEWETEASEIGKFFRDLVKGFETDSQNQQGADAERQKALEQEIGQITDKISEFENGLKEYFKQEGEIKKQLFVKERLLRTKQDGLLKTRDQKNVLSVEQARITTRIESLEKEAREALGENFRQQIAGETGAVPAGISEHIMRLKRELEMIGGVDDLTLQEYKETEERFSYLNGQSTDLEKAIKDLREVIKELDGAIEKEFDEAFHKVSERFSEYFRILFGGGKATMSILREDPAEEKDLEEELEEELVPNQTQKRDIIGIVIKATPPGKRLGGIAALSGGERALTAIALLCAMLAAYPSPFVVLDEVDAALDEANSIRFGQILGSLGDATQFITITHNRETMRQSHTLYGVTMGDDSVSRVLSLKLEQAAAYSSKN